MTSHDSLYLLRHVVTTPRIMYTLWNSPCTDSNELLRYNETILSTLSSTMNIELTESGWRQPVLPVRWDGLGIRPNPPHQLAPSAYMASATGAASLLLTTSILPHRLHSVLDKSITLTTMATKSQRLWDDPCCKAALVHLTNTAPDVISRARLYASLHETSGAWHHALPITSIGHRLSNDAIRIAVCLRLGLNQCQPHTCHCGTLVDATGTHGLACKKSAGHHPCHNQLNDVIWRALNRAQIPSISEPGGLSTVSRSDGKRPDGVTMIPWSRGRCLTWVVTSPDTLAPTNITRASGSGRSKKDRQVLSNCIRFETLGAWGEQATEFIWELGRRLTLVSGDGRETFYLRQRLSIAIQRGNAIEAWGHCITFHWHPIYRYNYQL